MEEEVFDLVVIGGGMMGSATAFHASHLPNTSVCLVGPPEPKSRECSEVFGCWHDEGRLYYHLTARHTWQVLSSNSIHRLATLEELTGIKICNETGSIQVHKDKEECDQLFKLNSRLKLEGQDISNTWKSVFPFLNLPQGAYICYEEKSAGHLNPRRLVEAYQKVAKENGACLVHEVVLTVRPSQTSVHSARWEVVTETGTVLRCKKVQVAVGGYAALKPLFQHVKPGFVPKLELRTQTVAYLQITEHEALRLRKMPAILMTHSFNKLDGCYIVPPIQYPDGKWYLKLGHKRAYEEVMTSLSDVTQWYQQQTGVPECVEELVQYLTFLLPGLKVECVHGDGCITSHTPDAEPYIDTVAEGLGVVLGGNGYGGKCCDELGRLAAHLTLLGKWESVIPRDRVRIKWEPQTDATLH